MIAARSTMIKTSVRPSQRAAIAPRRSTVRVAASNDKQQAPAVQMAAAGLAAFLVLASPGAAFAELDSMTGCTSNGELGTSICADLKKVDEALKAQPNEGVQQGAFELKEIVEDQAKTFQKNVNAGNPAEDTTPPSAKLGVANSARTANKADADAADGLRSQMAQLKSLLGL